MDFQTLTMRLLTIPTETSHSNQPQVVAKLADVCFDKCVSKPGASLDRYESACLSQCALRYLETGQVIMQRISGGGMQ